MKPVELQKAIYTVLATDGTLTAQLSSSWGVTAIFADTPQQNADDRSYYPFVSFGPDVVTPFETKSCSGGSDLVQINVWSRSGNYTEVKTISERIWELLHRQEYTIVGATLVSSDMEIAEYNMDPDGETRRGLMSFRVLYQND